MDFFEIAQDITDPNILARLSQQEQPKKLPHECEQCGQTYIPRMTMGHYICDECRDENESGRVEDSYERSHGMGPL